MSTIARIIEYLNKLRGHQDRIIELIAEQRNIGQGRASPEVLARLKTLNARIIDIKREQRLLTDTLTTQMSNNLEGKSIVSLCSDLVVNRKASETDLGYHKYTVEQILLAFAVHHMPEQNIVDAYDAILTTSEPDQYLQNLHEYIKHECVSSPENPFAGMVSSLISNGLAKVYDRKRGCMYDVVFADCVETVIRQLCALIVSRNPDLSTDVDTYFTRYPNINDPSTEARSAWNTIVGDLPGIRYSRSQFDAKFDLVSDYETIVDVICMIMHIDLPSDISYADRFALLIKQYTGITFVDGGGLHTHGEFTYGQSILSNKVIELKLSVSDKHSEIRGRQIKRHMDINLKNLHTLIVEKPRGGLKLQEYRYLDIMELCLDKPRHTAHLSRYVRRNVMRAINKDKFNDFESIINIDGQTFDIYQRLIIEWTDIDDLVLGADMRFGRNVRLGKFINLRYASILDISDPPKTLKLLYAIHSVEPSTCKYVEELRWLSIDEKPLRIGMFPNLKKLWVSSRFQPPVINVEAAPSMLESITCDIDVFVAGDLRSCTSLTTYVGDLSGMVLLPDTLINLTIIGQLATGPIGLIPRSVQNLTFDECKFFDRFDIIRFDMMLPHLKTISLVESVSFLSLVHIVVGDNVKVHITGKTNIKIVHIKDHANN